ncbi:hypothetical protein A6P39_024610 [Streptomyces sp. FXJ1.172]|nr:hypothetical protein [Streptomyces sp. FXJ1.172]WEO96953.1 hypothetical protein A6P39_024610 [Streptomyces sp. FXJ1.172]
MIREKALENDDPHGYDTHGEDARRTAAAVAETATPTAGVVPACLAP